MFQLIVKNKQQPTFVLNYQIKFFLLLWWFACFVSIRTVGEVSGQNN